MVDHQSGPFYWQKKPRRKKILSHPMQKLHLPVHKKQMKDRSFLKGTDLYKENCFISIKI